MRGEDGAGGLAWCVRLGADVCSEWDPSRPHDMQLVDLYPTLGDLLAKVEAGISGVWEGGEGFLEMAARRALSGRGKRRRPGVVLLAAECAGGATETSVALGFA